MCSRSVESDYRMKIISCKNTIITIDEKATGWHQNKPCKKKNGVEDMIYRIPRCGT
jgi:hypothetical protein